MLRSSRAFALSLTILLGCLGPSCASSGKNSTDDGPQHYMKRVADVEEQNTGFILAELDGSMKQWSGLAALGDKDKDGHKARAIEEELRHRSRKNFFLLTKELESGPVRNRMISAMALGFSNAPEALPALLSALEDPDERVEINALTALSQLASKDTPLGLLAVRMTDHKNTKARAMASSAIIHCLRAKAVGENLEGTARLGLIDDEPLVRTNCALILAELRDSDSIESLERLLYDETPIVRRAARGSITFLGMNEDRVRGKAARALASSLDNAESNSDEANIILHLQKLSSINHGKEASDWLEWANQMP